MASLKVKGRSALAQSSNLAHEKKPGSTQLEWEVRRFVLDVIWRFPKWGYPQIIQLLDWAFPKPSSDKGVYPIDGNLHMDIILDIMMLFYAIITIRALN